MINISYKDYKYFQAFEVPTKKDYSSMTEEQLYEEIKKLPEASELVLPNSWYEKFNLPLKECRNMKEFLAESPWTKKNMHMYVGKVETIPAKPGGNRPIIETTPPVVEVLVQNSFSDADETTTDQLPKVPTPNTSRDDNEHL